MYFQSVFLFWIPKLYKIYTFSLIPGPLKSNYTVHCWLMHFHFYYLKAAIFLHNFEFFSAQIFRNLIITYRLLEVLKELHNPPVVNWVKFPYIFFLVGDVFFEKLMATIAVNKGFPRRRREGLELAQWTLYGML